MDDNKIKARVLVIDDEQGMRDMLTFELSREGYEVDTAENGATALRTASDKTYDLAICDLKMPGMDGVQTLAALKKLDPDLEIIVATGFGTVDTAIACMKQGAYDYIQKPFALNELHALVEQALAKRRLKKKIAELISTRDQIVQSEKLALAVQFAAAVAHEVNNPLGVVKANIYSLQIYCRDVHNLWNLAKQAARRLGAGQNPADQHLGNLLLNVCDEGEEEMNYRMDDSSQVLRECLDGVNRIANLVIGFQSLAETHQVAQPQDIDVNKLVQECIDVSPETAGSGARKIRHDFEEAPRARVVRQDLQTALSNLLDYLHTSRPEKTEPIFIRIKTEAGRPCIEISDPRLKLSEDERLRIFDPRIDVNTREGRTMRMEIGLAIAHQILQRSDAEMSVHPGKTGGTTFRIFLAPATKDESLKVLPDPACVT
jgi:DNA-binding response OmpR family regulator